MDTTNPRAKGTEIWENPANHAAAAASILTYSASNADFRPAEQPPKALGSNLAAFMKKASTFPGFREKGENDHKLRLDGSFSQFEETIRHHLDDAITARGLRDLIPGYIQDKSLKEWVLSLVVLSKPENSDKVNIKLARICLTMSRDKSGTAYMEKQTASLKVSNLQVNSNFLAEHAEKFANQIPVYMVHDFIDFFASPKVPDEDNDMIFGDSDSCSKRRQTILSW
jgi:hypothetical protein